MMTESPLSIPVYDGSLVSVRSTSSAVSRLHPSAGAAKRKTEPEPNWRNGSLPNRLACPSCSSYLRFPIRFEDCGHHICSSCLPDIMRVAPRCPTCQQPISKDKITNDTDLQKEIQNLDVYCTNKEKGCSWDGTLRDLTSHQENCGYNAIECSNSCGAKFERRFMDKHLNEDCAKRTIECEFCHQRLVFEEEIPHFNICSEFKVPCPNNCTSDEFPRSQLTNHLENSCPKQEIACPFVDCGCEFRGHRTEITKHIKDAPGIHLNMTGETISIQKQLLLLYEERCKEQKNWIELLSRKVNTLEKTYGTQFIWKIDHYHEHVQDARTNKKTTLFSPPFYTSRHGYRLTVSICLCGDGKAKGKHVSLFICICRGDYDALLPWPFSHRITFSLLDQCDDVDNRRHITYSVKPNICKENKPFLGRPITDRNASFGAQKFTDLETMATLEYIKDDTIFIKVEIDNEEMIVI